MKPIREIKQAWHQIAILLLIAVLLMPSFVLVPSMPAQAIVLVEQPIPQQVSGSPATYTDQDAIKDASGDQANPTTNENATVFYLQNYGSSDLTSWIEFDISSFPANATITAAYLGLYYGFKTGEPAGNTFRVSKLGDGSPDISSWEEATATWTVFKTGNAWGTAGGDYDDTNYVDAVVPAGYGWVGGSNTGITITNLFKAAYLQTSSDNLRLHLRMITSESAVAWFISSEHASTTLQPLLTVEYELETVGMNNLGYDAAMLREVDDTLIDEDIDNLMVTVFLDTTNFDFNCSYNSGNDTLFTNWRGDVLIDYEWENPDEWGTSAIYHVQLPHVYDPDNYTGDIEFLLRENSFYLHVGNESVTTSGSSDVDAWDNDDIITAHHMEDYANPSPKPVNSGSGGTTQWVTKNACQGIATDGSTYTYTSCVNYLSKYYYGNVSLVLSRDCSSDAVFGAGATQISGLYLHTDGYLYVGANSYPGESGWICKYDPTDLTLDSYWSVGTVARTCEGGCYKSEGEDADTWWTIFYGNNDVQKYSSSWVLQATYDLGWDTLDMSPQSCRWQGNYLYTNDHEGEANTNFRVQEWNGEGFSPVRTPARPAGCTQGFDFDPVNTEYMWWGERDTDQGHPIVRSTPTWLDQDLYDSAVGGCYGTKSGATGEPTEVAGDIYKSQDFDGDERVLIITDNSQWDDTTFSVEAWIKTEGANGTIIANYGVVPVTYAVHGWKLRVSNGCASLVLYDGTASTTTTGDITINDGSWHQVVGVNESSTSHKIYVDGVLDETVTTSRTPSWSYSVSSMGAAYSAAAAVWSDYYTGEIDEARLYDDPVTLEYVVASYHSLNDSLLTYPEKISCICISEDISLYEFGIVEEGESYGTGISYFTLTHCGVVTIDVYISAGNMTSLGSTWYIAASASNTEYALKAGLDDEDDLYDITVLGTITLLINDMVKDVTQGWGLKFYAPLLFVDGYEYEGNVTLDAIAI